MRIFNNLTAYACDPLYPALSYASTWHNELIASAGESPFWRTCGGNEGRGVALLAEPGAMTVVWEYYGPAGNGLKWGRDSGAAVSQGSVVLPTRRGLNNQAPINRLLLSETPLLRLGAWVFVAALVEEEAKAPLRLVRTLGWVVDPIAVPFPIAESIETGDVVQVVGSDKTTFARVTRVGREEIALALRDLVGEIRSLRPIRRYLIRIDARGRAQAVSPSVLSEKFVT